MKVLIEHNDGSRSIQLEVGDRVRLTKDHYINTWKTDSAGELGTVITAARPDEKYPLTAFVDVQTDKAKVGGWGSSHIAPWHLEYIEPEKDRIDAYAHEACHCPPATPVDGFFCARCGKDANSRKPSY